MMMDHLVLMAGRLEASLAFYEALLPMLGYHKTREHVFVSRSAPAIDLKQAGDETRSYGRYAPGLNHIGFTAPDLETVERIAGAMRGLGFEVPQIQSLGGDRALFLPDPDGLRIEITAYGTGG